MEESDLLDIAEEGGILSNEEIEALIDVFGSEKETADSVQYGKTEKGATLEILDDTDDEESRTDKKATRLSVLGLESNEAWQKKADFFKDLCDHFEIILGSSITNLFGISARAEKLSMGRSTYKEVIKSAFTFTDTESLSCVIFFPFKDSSMKAFDIVEIELSLAFLMVDFYLKGDGLYLPKKNKITDFERSIMSKIMKKIMYNLTQVWHPSFELADSEPKVFSCLDLGKISYQEQPVISFPFNLTLQNSQDAINGKFTVHIPYSIMNTDKMYIDNLGTKEMSRTKMKNSSPTSIQEKIMDVPLQLQACFPSTSITFGELLNLKKGDIIKLGITTESKLNVRLQERTRFLGIPVLVENWKAVKICALPSNWKTHND